MPRYWNFRLPESGGPFNPSAGWPLQTMEYWPERDGRPRIVPVGSAGSDDLLDPPTDLPANLDDMVVRYGQGGASPILLGGALKPDTAERQDFVSSAPSTNNGLQTLVGPSPDLPSDLDDKVINYGLATPDTTLFGDSGDDRLMGGPGRDRLYAPPQPSLAGPQAPSMAGPIPPDLGGSIPLKPLPPQGRPPIAPPPVTEPQPFAVSRRIYWNGIPVARHTFTTVADPKTGASVWDAHYGPDDKGNLVELRDTHTDTARDDAAAQREWGNPNGRWGTQVKPVPAPAAAVIAAGRDMDATLGTPGMPAGVRYSLLPVPMPLSPTWANSNTATGGIVNSASQSVRPGAPEVGPPPAWTPGWSWYPVLPNRR